MAITRYVYTLYIKVSGSLLQSINDMKKTREMRGGGGIDVAKKFV
jgi:hypothetical protein